METGAFPMGSGDIDCIVFLRMKKPNAFKVLGLLSAITAAYLFLPVTRVQLNLAGADRERSVSLAVAPGGKIAIGFEHSLYKVEQIEAYSVRENGLLLESVYFGSFDALNYYDPTGEWPREAKGSGYEVVFRPPRQEEVNFAIARSTPVWLVLEDEAPLFLKDIPGDFSRFSLRVVRKPRVQFLLGR